MDLININGTILPAKDAGVSTDNGAFRYGYGLFETMLVRNGSIRLKEYHWDRLFDGLKQLFFEPAALMTREWLETEVLRTVSKNKANDLCRVRLQLYAKGGGLYSNESRQPEFIIECFAIEPDTLLLNSNGLTAGIATGVNKSADTLSNLKSCNALIYAVAARQAKANKWNDALIRNTTGNIIESTIANIFWIKEGELYTPPLPEGCVAGVMRRYVLNTVTVTEKVLDEQTLLAADEVFVTNAIKGIKWVKSIGEREYSNQVTQNIFNAVLNNQTI